MSLATLIVLLVALQRAGELIYARANTKRLLARGAEEHGAAHYPLIVLLHGAWLIAIAFSSPDTPVNYWLIGVFASLQGARLWVIATLGEYWTTRVIVLPGAPRLRHGAYRFLKHPNYMIVAAEIAVLPSAFEMWWIALIFSVLNVGILTHRIRVEDAALAAAQG